MAFMFSFPSHSHRIIPIPIPIYPHSTLHSIETIPIHIPISIQKLLPLPWESHGNFMGIPIPIPMHTCTADLIVLASRRHHGVDNRCALKITTLFLLLVMGRGVCVDRR